MIASIFALLLTLGTVPQGTKQLIDNNRATVREVMAPDGKAASIEQNSHDLVAIDLVKTTAFFVPKGTTHEAPQHAILVELKDVSVPSLPNNTPYPLAFPREGVKKILENGRVIIWDYTWTPGKPTVMHF